MDEATEAVFGSFERLAQTLPGGWSRRVAGSVGFVTGLAVPTLNGVLTRSTDVASVAAMLGDVAATNLPYCLQFQVGTTALARLAGELGLDRDGEVPLMCLQGVPRPLPGTTAGVRRLPEAEKMLHAEVAARGFEAPFDIFAAMVASTASRPEVAMYVAEVNGQSVATGLALLQGDSVGIFNVATPPEFRRHGYGAALTAAIVNAAMLDGAGWAWLLSSPDGYNVYHRLGFQTVCTWECWTRS